MSQEKITTSWHSYTSAKHVGHAMVRDIFNEEVLVEEKLDGSQFSFGVFNGELKVRSKGSQLYVEAPEKMFAAAVRTAQELAPLLVDGWTYRAEYLAKTKHNVLSYSRIPQKHLAVFDINDGHETYLSYEVKAKECERIGLEVVPLIYKGKVSDLGQFRSFIDRDSFLGGAKIEGVVVKNYQRFFTDGKAMFAKYVSEEFKEIHSAEFRKENPASGDICDKIIAQYRTPARWRKAVQHLKEEGKLESSPRDIGNLIKEAGEDTMRECQEEIKNILWQWAEPQIRRGVVAGLPQWYKDELVKAQFETEATE
jgi:hypothetical protein